MCIYEDTISILNQTGTADNLYRFQGGHSKGVFDVKTSRFQPDSREKYIYFSSGLDHHKFFTVKRIRQLLNNEVLYGTSLEVTRRNLGNPREYQAIRNFLVNTDKLPELHSVRLVTDNNFLRLMKENSCIPEDKSEPKIVERVDRGVYGGGYGVTEDWRDLLEALTLFTGTQRISREDILALLAQMKASGKVNRKENADFIFSDSSRYSFELSPSVESYFTKYKIIEAMEKIYESHNCSEQGNLFQSPTDTIKRVVEDYEANKSKILRIFDNHHTRVRY